MSSLEIVLSVSARGGGGGGEGGVEGERESPLSITQYEAESVLKLL